MSDLGRLGARPTPDIGVHVRPGGLTPSEEPVRPSTTPT
ncbi:hypothetical protein C791_7090 [Amycolatopsis azurea DSM 43854]|uniref:Uncharacterized protein n=1 Tax=Amycolatopsis azurea DSM 43854 TaxID=1238180 RepID=M2PV69_9PSEU|nr:hypothetical protein C791_7090 [Amycolatopsis azurea DSM 43854]